jgi:peptidoglycan/LPS O-acetylase OafA/YrhL
MSAQFRHRGEIDGLRALAVVPVILFHAGFSVFRGGFVGVDVFFVISGYLITSLVATEMEAGNFSLWSFYERRIRRIFPALFFVIALSVLAAFIIMLPHQLKQFARSVVSVFYFGSNFEFASKSGYFDASVDELPLLHTWSLAVEEQFYVVFPALVLFIWRFGVSRVAAILTTLALLSFAIAEWGWRFHPNENFYLLPGRIWELLLGSLAALYLYRRERNDKFYDNILSGLGLLLIVGSVFFYDPNTPFPSFYSLAPVLGTVAIILFATPATFVNAVFSTPPMVGIGLVSYSAYLWHQPLFAFARIAKLDEPSTSLLLGLCGVAFGLAWLTWKFVEAPFRNRSNFTRTEIFAGFAALTALMFAMGIYLKSEDGLLARRNDRVKYLAAFAEDTNPRRDECHSSNDKIIAPAESCIFGDPSAVSIAILGDSHAEALSTELGKAVATTGRGMRELTFTACVPFKGLQKIDYPDRKDETKCEAYNSQVFDYMKAHSEITILVIASRWIFYFEGTRFDNGEGGREKGVGFSNSQERQAAIGQVIAAETKALLALGKKVILVYPIPEVGWDVPDVLAREVAYGVPRDAPLSTSFDVFTARSKNAFQALDGIGNLPGLQRVYPSKLFCDTYVKGRCAAEVDGVPLYFDDDHPDSVGAKIIADEILGRADN